MSSGFGAPPKTGWAKMVSELHVENLDASLAFWREILGFAIAFQRPAERFVYLEHPEGHQVMLCEKNGRFETGPLEPPLGRGVMFQLYFASIDRPLAAIAATKWPLYMAPREIWRRVGDREEGQREFFVQDPDGYLIMVAEILGERSVEWLDCRSNW